jgi:molecular chaperone IbpA
MVTNRAMSLFDHFNQLAPYAVGFDRIFNNLNRFADSNFSKSDGYPPYNIRKEGDYNFVIEMALAGFGKKDIEVEVVDSELSVRSVKENTDGTIDDSTVYRGISYRKFERRFKLADDVLVKSARLEHGMLTINLERIVPEEKKPKLIEVK